MDEVFVENSEWMELVKSDSESRNTFITKYKPFIASFTCECCRRYVSYGVDEELSIALLAFDEAIERFNGKGNFLLYAKMIIKSRLIDYFKSPLFRENQNSFALYTEEDEEIEALKQSAVSQCEDNYQKSIRIAEIKEFNDKLAVFGIDFMDLAKSSPKHLITRKLVNNLIADLLKQEDLVDKIFDSHVLPLKEIEKYFLIPRKKLESYRKYIIAVIVLAYSDLDTLKEFLPIHIEKGGK